MYQKILTALDGSTFAEAVLPHVTMLADLSGAEVVLLTVSAFPPREFNVTDPMLIASLQQTIDDETKRYLERVAAELRGAGLHVTTFLRHGAPADEIVDVAGRIGADLIVMATHGRSGLSRWVMGSVADKVVRGTSLPVLLVRSTSAHKVMRARAERAAPYRKILVPLDGSALAEAALPHAQNLAQSMGSEIVLLRTFLYPVLDYASLERVVTSAQLETAIRQEADIYVQAIAQKLKAAGHPVSTLVLEGLPAQTIIEKAATVHADIVVMSTHGLSGPARWLMGSVTDDVLRTSPAPVLVIRPTDSSR